MEGIITKKRGGATSRIRHAIFLLPDGTEIPLVMERKSVKNLNLRVRPAGSLYLSMPRRLPFEEGERFLISRTEFVLHAFQRQAERRKAHEKRGGEPRAYESGERIPYLGHSLTIVLSTGPQRKAFRPGEELHFVMRPGDGREERVRLLSSWRKSEAKRIFAERLGFYHERYFGHCPKPTLTVREMTSRWGSCRKDTARITLNSLLLGAELPLIDYVVVHELAHLIHADHSPAYWETVAAVMPDYRERRAALRRTELIPPRVDSRPSK